MINSRMLILALVVAAALVIRADACEVTSLDKDWRFKTGDVSGAEKSGFNDATWQSLALPHCWGQDMALLKELGVTAIRCAHYQHSDYFYSLCDKAA